MTPPLFASRGAPPDAPPVSSSELALGRMRPLDGRPPDAPFALPLAHLVTHGVVVGMTGSGKTGLVTVTIEEALRHGVPVLVLDVKGDLPNLRLVPDLDAASLAPWVAHGSLGEALDEAETARLEALASERRDALAAWSIDQDALAAYRDATHVRVLTPGSEAGESLHLLSSLELRSPRWDTDPEGARASLSATLSLVLRLVGRDPDPVRSREHGFLAVLAEARLAAGLPSDLASLLGDVLAPPFEAIGALPLDVFLSVKARADLAASLNALLVSPSFRAWRRGSALDVGAWLAPHDGKTTATIVSVAHLDDEERAMVLGLVLEEVLTWVRAQPGTEQLRALVVFDEVYGYLPPHPASPPTKRPLVALMKQARAFGVGVIVATQNPMDLDYRALANAGIWCLGRLQTDADRERVVEGLTGAKRGAASELSTLLKQLAPRWFVVRDAHAGETCRLLQPRWAMSLLRGPMTRDEIRRAVRS